MRHTAASLAISAGANVKAVRRTLGHAPARFFARGCQTAERPFDKLRDQRFRQAQPVVSVKCAPRQIRTAAPASEGERRPWNGATYWQLPRNFSLFGSSWIASNRIVFREVLPFCSHGRFLGWAFVIVNDHVRFRRKASSSASGPITCRELASKQFVVWDADLS